MKEVPEAQLPQSIVVVVEGAAIDADGDAATGRARGFAFVEMATRSASGTADFSASI